jgi:hypothetical protein
MSRAYTLWVLLGAVVVAVFLGIWAATAPLVVYGVRLPISTLRSTVTEGARPEFIRQLTQLAAAEGFAKSLHNLRDEWHFFIQFWQRDIDMTVANPFPDATEFQIFIYKTRRHRVSPERIDALVASIKGSVGMIQGVTFATAHSGPP